MKAIILAAGKGTRLRPLTYGIPKPLLPLRGKPILDWVIRSITKEDFIDEVFVGISGSNGVDFYDRILSHTHGICIDSYIQNVNYGVPVSTIPTTQRETAGDLLHILQEKNIKTGEIMVVYGDNLTEFNVGDMINYHRNCRKKLSISATILLFEAPEKQVNRFGIANVEQNSGFTLIKSFIEKPKGNVSSRLANGGYYIIEVGDIINTFPKDKIKVEESIFPILAKKGKLSGFVSKLPFWLDISTLESYEEANKMVYDGLIIPPPITNER